MSRDLTEAQLRRQAEASGFTVELFWLRDMATGVSYGMTVSLRTGRVFRRESLANALRRRRAREQEDRIAALPEAPRGAQTMLAGAIAQKPAARS